MPDFRLGLTEYIAAIEFNGKEPTVEISAVRLRKVMDPETGRERDRLICYFKGKGRGWVMNTTNCLLVSAVCGSRDTDLWVGHKVTLCAKPVRLGRDTVLGIRVKGSPELKSPVEVEIKMPRKSTVMVTLVPPGVEQPEDRVVRKEKGLDAQARNRDRRPTNWDDDAPDEPSESAGDEVPPRDEP